MHANTSRMDRLENLENGLTLLRQALTRGPAALNPLEKEGVIRRFEYCLDLAWKAAKEYLEEAGLRISPVTPREVLRQAATAGLVSDGRLWIEMFDHRNLMAHNYDGVVLAEVTDAIATRYFPAMEQLRQFLTATVSEAEPAGVDQ